MAVARRTVSSALRGLAVALAGASVAACGEGAAEPRARPAAAPIAAGVAPLDAPAWISDGEPTRAPSRVLFEEPRRSIVVGEPAPPPEPTRPRRARLIDVSFRRADLENVARFLGDAGHFNVVVESGLTATVNVDFKKVEPFDALVAIARANGAAVAYEEGIVTVHSATSHARP